LQPLHLYVDSEYLSPYAMSVFVALTEKALPFELTTVDLGAGAQFGAAFSSLSVTQRVPTLVHDGFALSESSAIVEYLEDVFHETRVYPTHPRDRARARQIQAWLRSDLMPIREERSTRVVFQQPCPEPLSAAAQDAATKLFTGVEALLPPGATHLFGEWSIADTDLALMLNRLVRNGDPVPERLATYARQQWQRPSVQRWVNLR